MFQIVKIIGVPAEALPRLHQVLESDAVKSENPFWWADNRHNVVEKIPFAKLLSSKYDTENQTYTVVIRVWLKVSCYDGEEATFEDAHNKPVVLYPPLSVMEAIYKALGKEIFPEREAKVRTSKA